MKFTAISKHHTTLIKGGAILLIMCHNFLHWLEPVKNAENEFYYWPTHFSTFYNALIEFPEHFINSFFSYFGHFGVQIFIFISGYGLAMSFKSKEQKYFSFLFKKLKTLYALMITGVIFYFFFHIVTGNGLLSLNEWKSIGYKFLFIHTLIPDESFTCVGPWWFFGLIFQLYVFFPLIYKFIIQKGKIAFIVIAIISYMIIFANSIMGLFPSGILIMQSAIGHFPEFALGILLAIKSESPVKVRWSLCALSVIVFFLGNIYKIFFPFTFLSITYIFVCFIWFLKNNMINIKFVNQIFFNLGKYSMVLFATHGFLRGPFIALVSKNACNTLFMTVLFVIFSFLVSLSADKVYQKILLKKN